MQAQFRLVQERITAALWAAGAVIAGRAESNGVDRAWDPGNESAFFPLKFRWEKSVPLGRDLPFLELRPTGQRKPHNCLPYGERLQALEEVADSNYP